MNDDALAYAKELLEEFGGSYRAKIKAISRLREQFSLGLREAKQIVDTAYEERCAEEEMMEEEAEEEAFDAHPAIIDSFVNSLKGSCDGEFIGDADFVLGNLCDFLWNYHGKRLEEVAPPLVEEYLMQHYPRKVLADQATVERVPLILTRFFQFAGDTAYLRDPRALTQTVERWRDQFVRTALDPRHFGWAKSFMTEMEDAGVDLSDQRQVDAYIRAYNRRPMRDRLPPKPSTGAPVSPPPVGRNGPCPCGSGRKYKRCCGKA